MAQIDDLAGGSGFAKGVAFGLGVAVLLPVAAMALAPVTRPLARSAIKAGLVAFEKGREAATELGEMLDDLVAEVRDELVEERRAAAGASETGHTTETASGSESAP
ncbi:MAG: DUF5132 domain-containing protein [Thiohalocapsa sp.]|nr:DUF5132 domain-containing protein [Thiohalocapsa sp.]MCF7990796.1 DUF5132 domain-containing protein [Thiohalocapsa sp.]